MKLNSFLPYVLPLFAVCSLTAMAPMNLGFLLVFFAFLLSKAFQISLVEPPFGSGAGENRLLWQWSIRGYIRYALLISAACLISLIAAKIWPYAYADHEPDITWHGFQKIWYMLCPAVLIGAFIAINPTQKLAQAQFKNISKFWWLTTLALAVVAVIQFQYGWPSKRVIPTNPTHYHAELFFGHHLSTASILIFPTFAAAAIAFGGYMRNRTLHVREFIFTLAGLLILFLSYARAGWIAVVIGILLLFVRYLSRKQLLISAGVFALMVFAATQTTLMKERTENPMGIHERVELWKANIDFFKHRPITGIGWLKTQEMSEFYFKQKDPVNYKNYFWGHAHNNFFEMLGGTGILGVIAFLLWSFYTFQLAWRVSTHAAKNGYAYYSDFAWGLFIALILLHVNGLTNVTFWEGKVMHQQMLAIALLWMIERCQFTA
jgi:O-antigen ligase